MFSVLDLSTSLSTLLFKSRHVFVGLKWLVHVITKVRAYARHGGYPAVVIDICSFYQYSNGEAVCNFETYLDSAVSSLWIKNCNSFGGCRSLV